MGRPRKCAKHLELARGIEPPTCGLQNHCSAVELRQRPRRHFSIWPRAKGVGAALTMRWTSWDTAFEKEDPW